MHFRKIPKRLLALISSCQNPVVIKFSQNILQLLSMKLRGKIKTNIPKYFFTLYPYKIGYAQSTFCLKIEVYQQLDVRNNK